MVPKLPTRRTFLRQTLYAGAGLWVLGGATSTAPQMSARPRRISPNEKLGIAGIGAGGKPAVPPGTPRTAGSR